MQQVSFALYILCGKQNLSEYKRSSAVKNAYLPQGRTVLHTILENHFKDFVNQYDEIYSSDCGKYNLPYITEVVENYLECGDL